MKAVAIIQQSCSDSLAIANPTDGVLGTDKAAIAVAASILTTVYHMLRDGTCYRDLGPDYFARRNPAKIAARLANRIRNLGYHVEIRAAA